MKSNVTTIFQSDIAYVCDKTKKNPAEETSTG
jgi:hypothetical protein